MQQDATQHLGEAADAVFLSPRVVDQQSFETYSRILRTLIEQATGEARSLRLCAEEAAERGDSARSMAQELRDLTDRVLSAREGLDQRIGRLDELLTRMGRSAAAVEQIEGELERAIAGGVQALRRQADDVVARARDSLGEAAERASASDPEGGAAPAEARLESLERRLAEVESAGAQRERALEARVAELEARIAAAEGANAQGPGSPVAEDALAERLGELSRRAEAELRQRFGDFEGQLNARVEQIKGELGAATGPAIAELSQLVSAARAQAGDGGDGDPTLGAVVARAEALLERARDAERQADSLQRQSERAQRVLGDMLIEATAWIEGLESRRDALRDTLEPIRSLLDSLEGERLSQLRELIDPEVVATAAQQAARLEELLGYLGGAESMIEQMRQAAQEAAGRLRSLRDEHAGVLKELHGAPAG